MDTEATEGELITISCSVESFPASQLTLSRTSPLSSSPENLFQSHNQQLNKLRYEVKATAARAGLYTCTATNTEGYQRKQQKLVVKCKWSVLVLIRTKPPPPIKNILTVKVWVKWKKNPTILSYFWKIQMLPNMWWSNLNLISAWEKTRHWLCTVLLSPTLRRSSSAGWRWSTGSLKSLGRARKSHCTQSVLLTADSIAVQPQMKSELELLSRLKLK